MDPRNYGRSQEAQPQMTSRQHTRFSWQQPLDDEVPPYQEQQQQAQQHQPQQLATQQYQTQQQYQQYQQPQQQQQQYQHQHHQPQPLPQQQQQHHHHHHHQEPQQRVDIDASRHFSYAQTPAEMRAFVYTSSPSDPPMPHSMPISLPTSPVGYTPIDPRPQSMLDAQIPVVPPQSRAADMQPSHVQQVQPPVSPVSPQHSSHPQTQQYSPVSPIPHPQPVHQAPQANTQQSRHARQMSNLSPINTNVRVHTMPTIPPTPPSGTHQTSPLPQKAPITPISANSMHKEQPRQAATSPTNQASYAHEPYSPHGFVTGQTNNMHAVFSPDAAHGPNGLDFAAHQPGQISHPNMESESSHEWSNGLCACRPEPATCFTGLFCPCIVYGRTSYRLSQKSAKNDPTDMLGHSTTNGHCIVMGLSCGLWWLFPMLQRTRIRRAYKIKGSLGSDLLRGCCCCCCVVVQNEREVKAREEASRRWAGPASTDVYTRSGGMVYKPQQ
ncbi:PLAC8 family-domain-containing protein [Bipolaris maydis]|nr:PLAC8 family-domain-containing protein [Bipolaris maydis]